MTRLPLCFLSTLLCLLLCTICLAQNVTLNSQADADAFDPTTTTIAGDLIVSTTVLDDPVTDLSNLANLTTIGGKFALYNNLITDLDPLANLTTIGGNLDIQTNNALVQINGLSNVSSVGENVYVMYNTALASLNGLSGLSIIEEDLIIHGNAIAELAALANVTAVGGSLQVEYTNNLTDLDGLANISSVGGALQIVENTALENIDGLSNVTSIGNSVSIVFNSALTNLAGLSNLTAIESGGLTILFNTALTDCCGISDLLATPGAIVGETDIHSNPSACSSVAEVLASCPSADVTFNLQAEVDAFDGTITSIEGNLRIATTSATDPIVDLSNLANLTAVAGSITIINNDALVSLDGLAGITSVGMDLSIHDNSLLADCCATEDLLAAMDAVTGTVSIYDNAPDCSSEAEILTVCAMPNSLWPSPAAQVVALRTWPNPFTTTVTVDVRVAATSVPDGELCLFNSLGQLVHRQAVPGTATQTTLYTADFPAGMYSLEWRSKQGYALGRARLVK